MLKLAIDKNSITREVGFDLRFQAPISYEEFCNNPEYESIFESSSIHSTGLLFQNAFGTGGEIKELVPFENVISSFMMYDYKETYGNIYNRAYFPLMSDEEYEKLLKGESDELFMLESCLDDIKCIITKNRFFYYHENGELVTHTRLMYPMMIGEFNEGKSKEQQLKLHKEIRKKVKFTQTRTPNKIANYLLFLTIVSDIKLYILIHPYEQSYIIIDENGMGKNNPTRFFGVSLRMLFMGLMYFSSSDYIQSIKDKYKHLKGDKTKRVFQDLQEAIQTNASLKIKINVNKGDISYMDTQFRDQNLNRFQYLKEIINTSDTGHIAIEKYKGKDSAVVGHARKKYK